jgi:hypothetical protein
MFVAGVVIQGLQSKDSVQLGAVYKVDGLAAARDL